MEKGAKMNDVLAFKKEERSGLTQYVFNHLIVGIQSQNIYSSLPTILISIFDTDHTKASFKQPDVPIEGVDMKYILDCMKEVSRESGIKEFWFNPFGNDFPKNPKKRQEARLRLFSRYFDITPMLEGGYILTM